MRRLAVLLFLLAAAAPGAAAASSYGGLRLLALERHRYALVELDRERGTLAAPLIRRHGGTLVSARLRIWRLPSGAAQELIPRLERRGLVRAAEADRVLVRRGRLVPSDPLLPSEWWLAAVGADGVQPPGPGVPVTVVDTGVDLFHPEFAGRPNTVPLNAQDVTGGRTEFHGTAVSSVVAAPANGVGLVGIYPDAALQVFDADVSGGLTTAEVIAGIDAATARGRGVINLSLGSSSYDQLLADAVLAAFGEGVVVVAAAGNEREGGSPAEFPANLPHVLTVAATDETGAVTGFSNASLGVDLAAPGEQIPVAVTSSFDPSGYAMAAGTSFSAPIVAGATAWVWTVRPDLDNTQVFDLMRFSARDVGEAGFDSDTGFGLLDVSSALAARAPSRDPFEPNEDVDLVRPNGLFAAGKPALPGAGRTRVRLSARLDATEDPEDVYRVFLPPGRTLVATVQADDEVDLSLWGPGTRSVRERGAGARRDLLAVAKTPGAKTQSVRATNAGREGKELYVDAFLGPDAPNAGYALSIRIVAAKS